ncbi:MAG: TraR/DksA C4-type zinc finger protein [Chloroflexi bacterium]|nr:TraR/DksA C4-type zinc finger protein [Chloroflexota bacterium]
MDHEAPVDRLQQRVEEMKELSHTEHETAFGGDQREVTGELSTADQHPADVADFTFQRELQLTTGAIADREAQQAQDALKRGEQGRYGICAECGRPISAERLEARPSATLCMECQAMQEGARPGGVE